jgi:hypothetical protein
VILIDGKESIDAIHNKIWSIVNEKLMP